jgi:hypothetical protein
MSAAAVAAPTVAKDHTDQSTGFVVMQQPISLSAAAPVLADGSQLTYKDETTHTFTIDEATAKAGFSFGALVYRIKPSGAVEIFNGQTNTPGWIPQGSFDPGDQSLNPVAFAFDQSNGTWSGTYVLSAIPDSSESSFPTNVSGALAGKPRYGFIAVFGTPKPAAGVAPTTAVRSPLGAPFGVTATTSTSNVQPGLVIGTAPTQDAKKANGFAIFVKDATGMVAELIVSGDTGESKMVVANLYSGGTVRASIALCNDNSVALMSTQQVAIDAPVVTLSGTLQAQNIEYLPYGGGTRKFL